MRTLKKIIQSILFSAALAVPCLTFGQGFYISAGGGYSGGLAQGDVFNFLTQAEDPILLVNPQYYVPNNGIMFNYHDDGNTQTTEVIRSSLGGGGNIHLRAGYNFNNFIGVEAEGQYMWGARVRSTFVISSGVFQPNITKDPVSNINTQARVWSFTPSVVISGGFQNKWTPYAKAGLYIAVPKVKSEMNNAYFEGNDSFTDMARSEMTGNAAIGFKSSAGVIYTLSNRVALYGEIAVTIVNWKPEQEEITAYKANNLTLQQEFDLLSLLEYTEFEYRETTTENGQENIVQQPSIPLSSIGGNIGIIFRPFNFSAKPRHR